MIDRYCLQFIPSKSSDHFTHLSVNHVIAITEDGSGVAAALVNQLKNKGYRHTQVVTQVPTESDVVIALDGLAKFTDIEEAIACNRRVFLHARRIADRFSQRGGIFITVQSTGGTFGSSEIEYKNAWSAGIAGLTKTAAQEWPKTICQAIDLQTAKQNADQLAEKILQQLLSGPHDLECGLPIKEKPLTTQLIPSNQLVSSDFHFEKNAILVVSGGGRGITADCLLALVKQHPLRIVLLGRTDLVEESSETSQAKTEAEIKQALVSQYQTQKQSFTPALINQKTSLILAQREIKENLAAMKEAGSEVKYIALDILNAAALDKALNQVRKEWGPITGVVHAAGVLADKLIAQKSEENFDLVFNTKVHGLKNILNATRQDKLTLLLLFSSVAARFGNPGQSDYAMANEVLNKVAQQEQLKRGKKCLVKSYNWGPWEAGMVTPQLKALFEQRGIHLLSIKRGTELFVEELKHKNADQVEVVLGGKLNNEPLQHHYVINHKTYSFLTSHAIGDIAVIPACLALEWFARIAQQFNPVYSLYSINDFKVLKGIRLLNFHTSQDEFIVTCNPLSRDDSQQRLSVKLSSTSGILHYSAEIIMRPKNVPSLVNVSAKTDSFKNWPWDVSDIYQPCYKPSEHRLFHGKELQVIRELNGFSDEGGSAKLSTFKQKKLNNDAWQTDLFALDGILQLLQLWNYTRLKYSTLPTGIKEFILHDATLSNQVPTLNCVFNGRASGKYKTISDAWLQDANGKLYASMHGIEMCAIQTN